MRARFWLVWATRDAKRRWVQVVSIAVLIALGTGMYSSMSSMSRWRVASADASFARLRMHDLRVSLPDATYVGAGSLRSALAATQVGRQLVAEERLVVPTQVDASRPGRSIVVPGRVVGAPLDAKIDRPAIARGRALTAAERGRPISELEQNFARHYSLPANGSIRLAGGGTLRYAGQVYAPEYFMVTAPGADFGAEASFAVVFTSLQTAQALAGQHGRVNELVIRAPGTEMRTLESQLGAQLRRSLPGVGFTFTQRAQEPAYRLIYKDAQGDQRLLNVFAFLLLGAAAFAAFNLVSRSVEAQRREIGIGMALGVRPALLALRPVLLGGQIALLAVALGIPVVLWANSWLASVLRTWFPLPVLETNFEPDLFATGAALGLVLPLLATVVPVWRAVRVAPIEAIRVGARAGKSSGLAWLVKGVHLPGGSLANMPLRNVLRTPRRTLLTCLGVAAVVAIVVALAGVMDSFDSTLTAARNEARAGSPSRMTVDLTAPARANAAAVRAVTRSPFVGATQTAVRLPVTLSSPSKHFDAFMEIVPADGRVWRPSIHRGSAAGLVIAQVAVRNLGVGIGDYVSVQHPVPRPGGGFNLERSRMRVAGIHSSPFRFLVYAPQAEAARLGLAGLVNRISVVPARGRSVTDVKRALLGVPGVAAVQSASAATDAVDKRMSQFGDVLFTTVAIALSMSLLMAYNTSAINTDERARENATMFAFGVTPWRVLRLGVGEALLIGMLATVGGIALGYALLRWMVGNAISQTMPDVGMLISIRPQTFVAAVIAGTVSVAVAPLLTRRRLRRTDIPSTLRVVE